MRSTDRRIVRMRLAAQRISASDLATPASVVRWMTAMQAQDFAGATWSIGLRLPGSTVADVDAAILDRSIVRSWPMRGTLHFVAAEDLRWMLSLTSERLVKGALARRAALGLDERLLEGARDASIAALEGGRILARDAMYEVFAGAGVSPDGQRGYHVLWYLSQTGTLCFGPPEGRQQTFVLAEEWIRNSRMLEREEALGEFVGRYFRSHGPASIRDFAWWSSTTLGDARVGLAVARDSLSSIERDGEPLYFAAGADPEPKRDGIRILPGFDEYLLGYQDRTPQLSAEHAERIVPGGNGMFQSTIVNDGLVVGTWRRTERARGVVVAAQPFSPLNATANKGFARESTAYARFLGAKLIESPS
ncbi:winged helix DNA-binding domain-containing protein [Leifsonia bigeumensis]|uniref:Winged helix DNA-binding domain-containing protein n=1 Tax=Leifsonella bigeumensis TaxID=433643 RepID=A0ABP7FLK7_9MICO